MSQAYLGDAHPRRQERRVERPRGGNERNGNIRGIWRRGRVEGDEVILADCLKSNGLS